MKNRFTYTLMALFMVQFSMSQVINTEPVDMIPPGMEPVALTPDQMISLTAVPEVEVPLVYKGPNAPLIPSSVDNSTQPYFRPITTQSGYECGQSAGIAFNFTYEIDRMRNVPANVPQNQYPTHFTWDFLNAGNNYQGASAMDGYEVVRVMGTPNVTDYGGALNTGGYLRWMSGYPQYYNGMHNRIYAVYRVDVRTPEGLQTLKYWLFDHLESAAIGGVANFYGNYCSPNTTLPPGTPEAGKALVSSWGPSASHTWTVCGYNDSIRYDFNGDGQYTNNIDINSDGVVDMKDWEIGGLKFANGYSGTGWGNGGFSYMMYKALADDIGYGGIWNNCVFIIKVRSDVAPKLTMKVTLKHTSRDKLRVTAGLSTDPSATTPSVIMEFPAFNYQGGDHYMQGGTAEADKTIEFGLDITPLLSNINPGQAAKYFLKVQENDPSNAATGQITGFSLMDYTSTQEIPCASTNVPLVENGTTLLSINHTMNFSKVSITTSSLPPATLNNPYSVQLTGTSGNTPYFWDMKFDYAETNSTATLPNVTQQPLTPNSIDNGKAKKILDFAFPFYGRKYDTVYVCVDGYIMLNDQLYTWPYLIDKTLLFKSTRIISPFMADLYLYTNDGMWYEGDANSATFRWKAHIYNASGTSNLNFAVKLYADGTIEFYYGTMQIPTGTQWTGGLSGGDNRNWRFMSINNAPTITANAKFSFASPNFPVELTLSESGLLSGTITQVYQNSIMNFRVTDNNNVSNYKQIPFTVQGISLNYTVNAGGDDIVEYGETVKLSLTVGNTFPTPLTNTLITLSCSDPYVTMSDSVENVGALAAGQTITLPDAFTLTVSSDVPNSHVIPMTMRLTCTQDTVIKPANLTAYAPQVNAGVVEINDNGNGILEPGETSSMTVYFINNGGAKAQNVLLALSTNDPYITINSGSATIPLLNPGSQQPCVFNVTAAGNIPPNYLAAIYVSIQAANNYTNQDTIYIMFGQLIEDWETGDFTRFDWNFGFWPWVMDSTHVYEGQYCARNDWITDNNESILYVNMNILTDGVISFYKKVSCENDPSGTNYDYLAFFIDNAEQARWDGEIAWSKETYPVSSGNHTFKWVYHKDYSVSTGLDAGFVDYIMFPPIAQSLPVLSVTPDHVEKIVDPNQTSNETLHLSNIGGGVLNFSIIVYDTTAGKKILIPLEPDNISGAYLSCSVNGFIPGEPVNWTFTATNNTPDNDWIKNISIDFPEGINVSSATNFTGGSGGDLLYDNTTGNGVNVNWNGESSPGRGVIKNGESAVSTVTGSVDLGVMSNLVLSYKLQGDNTGAQPHSIYGILPLNNYGIPNNWLSFTYNSNNIPSGLTTDVVLTFNTTGMVPGTYACDIIINDQMNEQVVVPVTLTIPYPIGIDRQSQARVKLTASPNPFKLGTGIRLESDHNSSCLITIYDNKADPVRHFPGLHVTPGSRMIDWDGCDDHGQMLPAGMYTLTLLSDKGIATVKLIKMD